MSSPAELKAQILKLTRDYSALMHKGQRPGDDAAHAPWAPGQTIPYAGRVFDENEVEAAVGATLDFWLTLGPEGEAFEKELAALLGVKHSLLVNSGSSANLVALATFTTHKLPPHKRILPGDEVITVAAGFPTTVAPIIQSGAVAVFLDNDPITGNIRPEQLEAAYAPGKTKAVMIAHALGNPFDLCAVLAFCRKHDLWLIEDNCDALGCTYSMPESRARALGLDHLLKIAEANAAENAEILKRGNAEMLTENAENLKTENLKSESDLSKFQNFSVSKSSYDRVSKFSAPRSPKIPFIRDGILTAYTGTFGDISTQSFYPPHHLTMGEGGAVNIISKPPLKTYAESFRDWGRDCWCASGKDDTCHKRFGWQLGELPKGYDHKYIYSHLGYNLKPLDPQAAIGRQQLKKLPAFIEARKRNWETLRAGLDCVSDVLDFTLPAHAVRWVPPSERARTEKLKLGNSEILKFESAAENAVTRSENAENLKRGNAETAPEKAENLKSGNADIQSSGVSKFQNFSVSEFSDVRVSEFSDVPVSEFQNFKISKFDFSACFEWDATGCRVDTSWFGFMLRVKAGAPFSHTDLARALDEKKIGNRMFFGGNLLRQPVFVQMRQDRPHAIRLVGSNGSTVSPVNSSTIAAAFPGADAIMNEAIFLGTYPGLTAEMLAYEIQVIRDFVAARRK
ncbi:MAG: lipopolysaccharide biosynthesis protein RfbH [Verrucomicrobia bacterium]|nr:lipopolysaccharide biosynthesis protein RfbH [Verrucomicrobiota bacterium]